MSLTLRITLIFLLVCGLGFSGFINSELDQTKRRYREATEEPLIDFATILAAEIGASVKDRLVIPEQFRAAFQSAYSETLVAQVYDLKKERVDLRVYITDAQGIVIFDSDKGRDEGKDYSAWNDVRRTLAGLYGARSTRDNEQQNSSVLYVAAPIKVDGKIIGSLTVAKPNKNANWFIEAAKRSTFLLGFVTFLGVGLLSLATFWFVTKPLRLLTSYANSIRDGKRASLPPLPRGELQTLGAAFDEMREALEGKKYIEHYVQTLTHELKSPITGIRAAAELLREDLPPPEREKFMGHIERECGRIKELVDKLLSLSSLQAMKGLTQSTELTMAPLVAEVIENSKSLLETHQVIISFENSSLATLNGDAFWLKEAISNLLLNAIEFSPRTSTIEVRLRDSENSVILEIQDHGPGIPDWALDKCFDQFYSLARPGTGKKSSGLGLTIVKEVAELHGGSVSLENSSTGGLHCTLRLPMK